MEIEAAQSSETTVRIEQTNRRRILGDTAKLILYQTVDAHRVVRRRGSHISSK
jgi:mannose-6-phosphate isomerase class I